MIITILLLNFLLLFGSIDCSGLFNGIPTAFGDLDLNKRTDIVVIGDDGTRIDIYYQHQRPIQPPLELGFSCKSDKPVIQVYLADIDSDGNPNLLPLVYLDGTYVLKSLIVDHNSSTNCHFTDLGVEMKTQPLLFDLEGDLRTDFMSLDKNGLVSVWKPPKPGSNSDHFEKMPPQDWSWIAKEYFEPPHSNSFIDINHDNAADIVLSAKGARIAYLYSDPDPNLNFKKLSREFLSMDDKTYDYGQSSLVDINADGRIDHILPRCNKYTHHCEIIVLYINERKEVIFRFEAGHELHQTTFAKNYQFPITLRASDLDGDGYTDFVAVTKHSPGNKVVYLHNIPAAKQDSAISGATTMTRTFELQEILFETNQTIQIVTLFDINEDGKVDMLIGSSESEDKPSNLNVTAKMNYQMVDACFMKVLVTNGFCSSEAGSNGQSAQGPFICFELSQNDGKKMQGCAGQLSQSSHFALQPPYVIFGLGQTPHFVETLNVSIPGFGADRKVRTRLLEQIVPDAQVIIIPKQRDNPNSWDYKMFLSPMSDLVFSTLIALAVLCLLILFIIFILHRQETLEDAAEHEEYKRHWPESR